MEKMAINAITNFTTKLSTKSKAICNSEAKKSMIKGVSFSAKSTLQPKFNKTPRDYSEIKQKGETFRDL